MPILGTLSSLTARVYGFTSSIEIDFTISPSVNGISEWSLVTNGALILDGGTATTYTITAQRNTSKTVKMWGQGKCQSTGGYSTGSVTFTTGNTYTVKLNTGGGDGGSGSGNQGSEPGGGYAGIFNGTSITQGNAIMIAGGGGGSGLAYGCQASGGNGGGNTGGNGTNSPDGQFGQTGGSGGTQGGGGGAGTGGGGTTAGISGGSALQGGRGGNGIASPCPNAAGGGGGGGGYYGGGGGAGGNDGNFSGCQGTRSSAGGGGGSGYINGSYVTGGSTGSYQDAPNRGSAGQSGGPARVVIEPS